jgi:hypothetical protein
MRIKRRAACASDRVGPLYSLPKVSCSACSAGVIDPNPDSESSEFKEPSVMSSSDNSLKSVSDSESTVKWEVSVLPAVAHPDVGEGAIAWVALDEEAETLFPLFSSMWARSAGWYSIAFAGDDMSIRGI